MTVTSPASRRALPRIGAVAALLALFAGSAAPAFADTSPSPTPSIEADGELELTLAPISGGVVRSGEGLAVSLTVNNGTEVVAPASDLTLELGSTALAGRSELTDWLAGDDADASLTTVGTTLLGEVEPLDRRTAGIVVPGESPDLAGRAPGVYPLRATATAAGETIVSTSVIVVPDDATAAVPVGVVVPITAPALTGGLLTAAEVAELTAADGELTALLDAVDGTTAILAVDPAIPAAIRVLGSSAPATAVAWLDRLIALDNSRFALQYGDADVAAQLQAGLTAPLQPTSLQYYMDASDFAPSVEHTETPSPTATPSATPTPDAVDFPTLEELLDIGTATADVYWPLTGTAGADVVTAIGGIGEAGSVAVVSSAATAAGADGATVAAHADANGTDTLVYDAAVSDALRAASELTEGPLRGAALTEATAHLAFARAESGGQPLLVTLDRGTARSRIALTTAIDTATGATPIDVDGLLSAASAPQTIADVAADSSRTSAVATLTGDEQDLAEFATILDDPSLLTGRERASMLQVLGGAWAADPAWPAAYAEHLTATDTTLASVTIPSLTDINLLGSNVPLRIWVRNELEWPVNVVLIAVPDDPRLVIQRTTAVRAEPESNTRVEVPVEARIGSGEVILDLQLRSQTFVAIGQQQTITVAVRAEWEGIGLTVLGVLVGTLLVIGVVRTVRRRRRGSDETDVPAGDAPAPDAAGSDAAEPDAAGSDAAEEDVR